MPISQVQKDQILKITVGLFGATPGADYLALMEDVVEGGASVEELASILSRHPIFTDDVIDGLDEDGQVAVIMEHFGLEFDGAGDANEKAQAYIEASRADGQDWGQIVYTGVIYLADDARRLPEFDDTATLLNNRALVSDIFSAENSSTDLAYLQGLMTEVTEDSVPLTPVEAQEIVDQYVGGQGPGVDYLLTAGIDHLVIKDGDTVTGNSATFNPGDSIQGNSGTVNLFLDDSVTFSGTLNTIDIVNVDPGLSGVGDGTVVVNAQNWENIGQLNINETEAPAAFTMQNIQGSLIPNILVNDLEPGASNTFDFDGQDLNDSLKTVDISVREAMGTVSVINDDNLSATEIINLHVQDTLGFESTLEDFVGDGTTTLTIDGGAVDINFEITGALDAGITTLDATGLLSNASLNVSASSETMAISMGDGNDTVYMGDTLFDDTLDGGAGDNVVDAEFTNTATRRPTMSNFQTLDAAFHAAVTFDGTNVDDLETANLRASEGRADFNNMDETFATVNVLGDLAQGVEVDYAPHQDNIVTNLTVNIEGDTTTIGNAGNDYGIETNANVFTLNHNGDEDVTIFDGIKVDDNSSTVAVSIINNSTDDLIMNEALDGTVIVDGNTVRDLVVMSTSTGDIIAPPPLGADPGSGAHGDLMREANDLQNYTVQSVTDSDITVGRIGETSEAVDLETVTISAGVSSWLDIGSIDAEEAEAATVDQITIDGNRSSWITLHNSGLEGSGQWLDAASVNNMTVTVAEDAIVDGDATVSAVFDYLSPVLDVPPFSAPLGAIDLVAIELNLQAASSTLTVSGEGTVTGFLFEDDNFTTVDATGLTGSGLVIIHDAPVFATGFTFKGSEQGDYVSGTFDADTLWGNGGDDVLAGLGGNDQIHGGDGDDVLFGDVGTAAFAWSTGGPVSFGAAMGNDIIDGGAGNDIIVGGRNVVSTGGSFFAGEIGDVLTGGLNNDQFIFRIAEDGSNDTGKSGGNPADIWQDIITDFGIGNDNIILDIGLGAVIDSTAFQIAYFDNVGSLPTFYGAAANPVSIVLRRGDYDDVTGTFTPGTVQGALVDQFNDIQLLVNTDGFPYIFPGELSAGGGVAFAVSEHEIGLIDAYDHLGSLVGIGDITFV